MSETTTETSSKAKLYSALAAAQKRAEAVEKDATNSFHKYKYASAEAIIAEARQALSEEGLSIFPLRIERDPDQRDHVWEKGTYYDKELKAEVADTWISVPRRIRATYLLLHSSGESMEFSSTTPVIPEKGRPEDKAEFGARTENLGYTLRDLLLLPRVNEENAPAPSARDDRGYQQRGPQQPKQPSAAPPRQQQNGGQPGPKAGNAVTSEASKSVPTAADSTAPATTSPAQTTGGAAEKPPLYTEAQDKRISSLFKQLRDMGTAVSGPGASAYVMDLTGKMRGDMTVVDGDVVIADLERKIAAKELWLKKPAGAS